ncbi:hypothetical protein L1987_18764 [Smallanthus sonchifolius]|uniref:Uncharacterized protein n=1 Tax=Smallanthus sonchifolius TaxID=185202 RepID=A0ACB9J1N2_9ASTR|nr:hypothetical protein L1987_18764 [Smallanthus sonchifolius]
MRMMKHIIPLEMYEHALVGFGMSRIWGYPTKIPVYVEGDKIVHFYRVLFSEKLAHLKERVIDVKAVLQAGKLPIFERMKESGNGSSWCVHLGMRLDYARMKNLSNVGKRFYKETSAGESPKIGEKKENTTKGKEIGAVEEVSDDDFVTPRIKRFKINEMKKATIKDPVVAEWRSQFDGDCKKISVKTVLRMMKGRTDYGRLFKLNFLVVFNTIMGETTKSSTVNQRFLTSITSRCDTQKMNWCGYIITCLERTKQGWNGSEHFNGPLTFLAVLYANDQSQGINDRHNELHAISYFTTNTLNSLEDILEGELFEKQLEAGYDEHTNKDNCEGTTGKKSNQQLTETDGVNVDQGWVQAVDRPGNINHPILVEARSTRRKCSKQPVDMHGQVNEPILIDDRSTGKRSSKQQTSNTNTCEKDGNQEDKSTTSIRSTPDNNVPMTQFINDFQDYCATPTGQQSHPVNISNSGNIRIPMVSQYGLWQIYNDEQAADTREKDSEQGREEELNKQLKEFEVCILRIKSALQRASVDYPNSEAIRKKQLEWQILITQNIQPHNNPDVIERNFTTPPCQGDTQKVDVWDSTQYKISDTMMAEVDEKIFSDKPMEGPSKQFKNHYISTLDLGISQNSPPTNVIRTDGDAIVDEPIGEAIDGEFRKKRAATLSDVLRSPYVERPVKVGDKRTRLEDNISNYIFSATGFEWEIVYSTSNGGSVMRVLMETMSPGLCIHHSCISAWSTLLNYEESEIPLLATCREIHIRGPTK